MDWRGVLDAVVKVIGFVLTVAVSGGVIFLLYRAFARLFARLIGDEIIARALSVLGLILLIIKGLAAALRYVTQPELRYLHTGLTDLLGGMADVVQWVALIAAILFVGYTFRGWRGPDEEAED